MSSYPTKNPKISGLFDQQDYVIKSKKIIILISDVICNLENPTDLKFF